ncbi:MAG: Rha family transcriptional regulator [Leptothrix sp. (in: b-proteobacteria)]
MSGTLQPALFPAAAELVTVDQGQPMTNSRRVAERFGKRHSDVLRSIQRLIGEVDAAFAERNFASSDYTDPTGRRLPEYHLTQAGFALLAMGFSGADAVRLKVGFIRAFEAMAGELQRIKSQRLAPGWKLARLAVARQHSAVNAVLVEMRRAAGKDTQPHHLANEARLIGYALTGVHAGIDRDTLDAAQLALLQRVESRDTILIVKGVDYEGRKAALRELVLLAAADPAPAAHLTLNDTDLTGGAA